MGITRRNLLASGGLTLAAAALPALLARRRRAVARSNRLLPDSAKLLDLPSGFTYSVIDRTLDPMSDGYRVPGNPDGMACFAGAAGTLVLMRNHELDVDWTQAARQESPKEAYDERAFGAVTRIVVDERTRQRVSSNLVLVGTLRNCGGGRSPWGWLSAEESVERGHGYVFRCPVDTATLAPPDRILVYGRFNHEAVAIDAGTHHAYLTEDQEDGCLYRFAPEHRDAPFVGKLQALKVRGAPRFDSGVALSPGQTVDIEWVDIPEPDPEVDCVRDQAQERGAALVRRGEGIVAADGCHYVCATIGGRAGLGQILRLRDGARPTLEAVFESPGDEVLNMPDNITLSRSGHVFMAEDGLEGLQYVRAITPAGIIYDVARSASAGELAGLCFSPDGQTLFVNMYRAGVTAAITGPFSDLGRV